MNDERMIDMSHLLYLLSPGTKLVKWKRNQKMIKFEQDFDCLYFTEQIEKEDIFNTKFVEPIVWSLLNTFYQIQSWSLVIAKFQPLFSGDQKQRLAQHLKGCNLSTLSARAILSTEGSAFCNLNTPQEHIHVTFHLFSMLFLVESLGEKGRMSQLNCHILPTWMQYLAKI